METLVCTGSGDCRVTDAAYAVMSRRLPAFNMVPTLREWNLLAGIVPLD
jgi:hypothetical protein